MVCEQLDRADAAGEEDALSGSVKWFDVKKGFGFIVAPDGRDVFVHFSSILGDGFRSLKDGEMVEYELTEGDKGLHAKNVRRSAPRPEAGQLATAGRGEDPLGRIIPRQHEGSMQRAAQKTPAVPSGSPSAG